MSENGNNHLICGYLNAHHCTWDKACNYQGVAIHRIVKETPNAYLVAAAVPSYHKVINSTRGGLIECSSNPYVGISRTADTTARAADRSFGKISDHRPVMFSVRTKVALKDTRRRVAKSLFYAPKAVANSKLIYERGEEEMSTRIDQLAKGKAEEAKSFFMHLERYVTEPWESAYAHGALGKSYGGATRLENPINAENNYPGNGTAS